MSSSPGSPYGRPGAQELFVEALRLAPRQRRRFVVSRCGTNLTLCREVLSLLEAHEASAGFLEEPIFSVAGSTPDDDSGLEPGTPVDRYVVVRRVGEGGMGDVYLAEQSEPVRRRVALKVIKRGMDTRRVVARFEHERQALAMMSHPCIAGVLDAGACPDGRPYVAMEYVDGRAITDHCDAQGTSVDDRVRLMIDVCDAVQHAHQRGIIHRDLKPSNILVAREDGRPKIIDFGIAKAIDARGIRDSLVTQAGMALGTPAYMSPEQACLEPVAIDTRCDIYSLGMILYRLLVGTLPDTARSPLTADLSTARREATLSRYPSRHAAALAGDGEAGGRRRELSRRLRGDLDAILLKALEPEPERRYATASELAADLQRYLDGRAVEARAPSWTYRTGRLVLRHRALFGSVAAGLLAVLVALAAVSWALVRVQRERDLLALLADGATVRRVELEGDRLWPAVPERLPAIDAWLAGDARELIERLPRHRGVVERLSTGSARPRGPGAAFADRALASQAEQAADAVRRIEAFTDPVRGYYARMVRRRDEASTIRRRSIDDHRAAWRRAREAIATHPAYGGLDLSPQLGLVPLGPDPRSGLWEFAHLPTGAPARRLPDGRLELRTGTGLVFVLVPAGTFRMGARRPRFEGEVGPNVDPDARTNESPVHDVTIGAPFFISKYELTQAQWRRLTGENPSLVRQGETVFGLAVTGLHPLDNVTWYRAVEILARLGLALPTDAQWEYAQRAGTTTPYFSGRRLADLEGYTNLGDLTLAERAPTELVDEPLPWHDGYPTTAPVGSFLPNPFGLHDTMGNVIEWCRDAGALYEGQELDPLDGERPGGDPDNAVLRGGWWRETNGHLERSARRVILSKHKAQDVGIRAVRAVDGG